jgi:phosphoribosylformylglycinamidine synthase
MAKLETFFNRSSENQESVETPKRMRTLSLFPKTSDFDHSRSEVMHDIKDLGVNSVKDVKVGRTFFFEGFSEEEIRRIRSEILHEGTHMDSYEDKVDSQTLGSPSQYVCVSYQKQVSNPELDSLEHAIENIGIPVNEGKKVQTSEMFLLYGDVSESDRNKIEKMIVNVSIQEGLKRVPEALGVKAVENDDVESIPLSTLSDDDLVKLSEEGRLFLNLEEMKEIQKHFNALKREPTDCELEIIAQAWSEHCGHKTFKAEMIMNGEKKSPLYSRLKAATKEINHPDVLSCFVDNSGVVRFDEKDGVCIKAETHSAPAAIEPFGGTETGVGGVIRDILGTGLGAKPIAVMDVLCFGDLELKDDEVPPGCLHPKNLLRKVVAGVESYGNKVGLPNISGALYFDNCFRTKPVVLAGSIGLIPVEKAEKGKPHVGDAMICIGGTTGRDGIHGATFSSGQMTDKTKALDSTAVQIGYPVLKRQVMDVLEKLFEKDLIHALTDSGGGGLSSVITEICEDLGGTIDLHEITTKYEGLRPWELVLSESQERMVLAIPPEHAEEVLALCEHYGINADKIGTFGDGDNILRINYKGKDVAELDLGFVLDGNPQKVIEGVYQSPEIRRAELPALSSDRIKELALQVLNDLNVCSREGVIRKYDHVVTGCTLSPYFHGKHQDTPQDGLVLRPKYDSDRGLMTTHGLAPEIGGLDPYTGSLTSVIEAISNAVARGADPSKIFLIDNFIHPRPDNPEDVGTLDRSLEGVIAGAKAFGTPFVSGKDSLGGTYQGADGTIIKANPMVVVTALSVLENAGKAVPSYFQKTGSQVVVLGECDFNQLGGSVIARKLGLETNDVPQYNLEKLKKQFDGLYKLMQEGHILSCHDIKEGGLFTALSEMSFGNEMGLKASIEGLTQDQLTAFLFNEATGRFVVEIPAGVNAEDIFRGLSYQVIGETSKDKRLDLQGIGLTMQEMKNSYHNQYLEDILPVDRESMEEDESQPTAFVPITRNSVKSHPRALVVKAPGTNSERETAESFNQAGAKSRIIDIADLNKQHFAEAQILAIPGGFSYGDDIYAGKVFSLDLLSRFKDSVIEFAEEDKLILGICNGFQVLVRTGLLPNRNMGEIESNLLHNDSGQFICRDVKLRIEKSICKWTKGLETRTVRVPIAHGEGRFFAPIPTLKNIEDGNQVAFRYVDANGQNATERPYNPNGSLNAIAGITDPSGRILGMMPHPERDPRNYLRQQIKDIIGLDILRGGVSYFQ